MEVSSGMRSTPDPFNRLKRAIESYKKLEEGGALLFSEEGEFTTVEKGLWASLFSASPLLSEEVAKANAFIDKEVREITAIVKTGGNFSAGLEGLRSLATDVTEQLSHLPVKDKNALRDLQDHLKLEMRLLEQAVKTERGLYVVFDDLTEVDMNDIENMNALNALEEMAQEVEDDIFVVEEKKIEKGKEPILDSGDLDAEIDSFEVIERSPPTATAVEKSEVKEINQLTHIKDEDVDKIKRFVKNNQKRLFQSAMPKGRFSLKKEQQYWRQEVTGLPLPIQIHLPKGKKTKPGEMQVIIHLKPNHPVWSDKLKRNQNVIFVGAGAFKQVRLSVGYVVGNPRLEYSATATLKAGKGKKATVQEIRDAIDDMDQEIKYLQRLEGKPGVVQIKGYCVYPIKLSKTSELESKSWLGSLLEGILKGKQKKNMVMSYADSDLMKEFEKDGFPSEPLRQQLTLGILQGLTSIHSTGIMHLDIKPENILLFKNAPLIADFGLARDMNDKFNDIIGSDPYIAPEIWRSSFKRSARHTVDGKADVYSTGVMLYKMKNNNRYPPYMREVMEYQRGREATESSIVKSMEKWHLRETSKLNSRIKLHRGTISPELKEVQLILGMLDPNPAKRLSSDEAFDAFNRLYRSV